MSNPELKPMPKGIEQVLVTKQSAARSQLESAIWLWFNAGDPVSIHALAIAAHEVFNALISKAKDKPSYLQEWLGDKSKGRQIRVRAAQNFFKHGATDLNERISLPTIDAEVHQLVDSTRSEFFRKLFPIFADRYSTPRS